jgi:hypothetical protein
VEVDKRNSQTLIPIIQQYILPGKWAFIYNHGSRNHCGYLCEKKIYDGEAFLFWLTLENISIYRTAIRCLRTMQSIPEIVDYTYVQLVKWSKQRREEKNWKFDQTK